MYREYVERTELLHIKLEHGADVLVLLVGMCGLKLQKLKYNSRNGKF